MNERFNMPWEERPAGCTDVMWRYSKNPVIGRYHIPSSNSIFNSAVVPFGDGFAGGMQADILAENAEQDAAFRVRQRGKQRRTDQLGLRGDAARSFTDRWNEHRKIAFEQISGSQRLRAGVNHRIIIFVRG